MYGTSNKGNQNAFALQLQDGSAPLGVGSNSMFFFIVSSLACFLGVRRFLWLRLPDPIRFLWLRLPDPTLPYQ